MVIVIILSDLNYNITKLAPIITNCFSINIIIIIVITIIIIAVSLNYITIIVKIIVIIIVIIVRIIDFIIVGQFILFMELLISLTMCCFQLFLNIAIFTKITVMCLSCKFTHEVRLHFRTKAINLIPYKKIRHQQFPHLPCHHRLRIYPAFFLL
jgi:hypothetical protein